MILKDTYLELIASIIKTLIYGATPDQRQANIYERRQKEVETNQGNDLFNLANPQRLYAENPRLYAAGKDVRDLEKEMAGSRVKAPFVFSAVPCVLNLASFPAPGQTRTIQSERLFSVPP